MDIFEYNMNVEPVSLIYHTRTSSSFACGFNRRYVSAFLPLIFIPQTWKLKKATQKSTLFSEKKDYISV